MYAHMYSNLDFQAWKPNIRFLQCKTYGKSLARINEQSPGICQVKPATYNCVFEIFNLKVQNT